MATELRSGGAPERDSRGGRPTQVVEEITRFCEGCLAEMLFVSRRRGGNFFGVKMVNAGSYIVNFVKKDFRWCAGNLRKPREIRG
jgi:hypothetical protein